MNGGHAEPERGSLRQDGLAYSAKAFMTKAAFGFRRGKHEHIELQSTVFHLKHSPCCRAGLGPVAVAVTGPGAFGLVAR